MRSIASWPLWDLLPSSKAVGVFFNMREKKCKREDAASTENRKIPVLLQKVNQDGREKSYITDV